MSEKLVNKVIGETFLEIADCLKNNKPLKKAKIGIAAEGSEHGEENLHQAVELLENKGYEAVLIEGENAHKEMEEMLDSGNIDGAVTMHYPFPIGVSTVGKIMTPAMGKPMYLATTTGTADTDRVAAMIRNAVYGIIAAKADGIVHPTVGIANVDGARQCEKALTEMKKNGYNINLAKSNRADGGIVMRGNDLLQGSADVMVLDSLTGNLMIKIFSAYNTGGNYEALGWGYGPGVGPNFNKVIMIVSRASGAPVIAGAAEYAANLISNDFNSIVEDELKKAENAGLEKIIAGITAKNTETSEAVTAPPKEVVTEQIAGIDVMDLDDAMHCLWGKGIYAEGGMGCTGPVIRISTSNKEAAAEILKDSGFID